MENAQIETPERQIIEKGLQSALASTTIVADYPQWSQTSCFKPVAHSTLENHSKLCYTEAIPTRKSKGIESTQKIDKEEEKKEIASTKDTIQRYKNTCSFPQSVHGVIIVKQTEDGTPMWGSGVLIGTNIVLTAAYNIYDDEKPIKKRYPCIKFIPGANGDEAPFGEIEVDQVFAPEDFINHKEIDDENGGNAADYALLYLRKPIGCVAGYFGLHAVLPSERKLLDVDEVSIVGYPAHEIVNENKAKFEQWGEKGIIIGFDEKRELIHCKNNLKSAGLTGGAVFYEDTHRKNQFYVIGIYLGNNSVCWITKEKFNKLSMWITEARDKKFKEILQNKSDEDCIKALNFSYKAFGAASVSLLLEWKLNSLEELNLAVCNIDERGIKELVNNSKWPKLRTLNLKTNNLDVKGCQILGSNRTWKNLKTLTLDINKIGDLGVKELVQNNTWADLSEISFNSNEIGDQGALLIGSSDNWKKLKKLNLGGNQIGDQGAIGIGKNVCWKDLEVLELSKNQIGAKGAGAIAMNTIWVNLKKLNLSQNNINEEGGAAIGANTSWAKLEKLLLGGNKIGDKGAVMIGSNSTWKNLRMLYIWNNNIGEEGGAAIGNNTTWSNLADLNLRGNRIGNKGAAAIAGNTIWAELTFLQLESNSIGDEGAVALGRNIAWKQMQRLNLFSNEIGWKGMITICHNPIWTKIETIDLARNRGITEERKNLLKITPLARLARITV